MPPREHDDCASPRKQSISMTFIAAVFTVTVTLGVPSLIWGGSISSKVDDHTKQIDALRSDSSAQLETLRKDIREDLRDINKKLDSIAEKVSK